MNPKGMMNDSIVGRWVFACLYWVSIDTPYWNSD